MPTPTNPDQPTGWDSVRIAARAIAYIIVTVTILFLTWFVVTQTGIIPNM